MRAFNKAKSLELSYVVVRSPANSPLSGEQLFLVLFDVQHFDCRLGVMRCRCNVWSAIKHAWGALRSCDNALPTATGSPCLTPDRHKLFRWTDSNLSTHTNNARAKRLLRLQHNFWAREWLSAKIVQGKRHCWMCCNLLREVICSIWAWLVLYLLLSFLFVAVEEAPSTPRSNIITLYFVHCGMRITYRFANSKTVQMSRQMLWQEISRKNQTNASAIHD